MKRIRRIGAASVLTLALATGAGVGAAFADDAATDASLLGSSSSGLHTDYAGDVSALSDTDFPSAFDLRNYNGTSTYDKSLGRTVFSGGINYVGPVKKQDPMGSCWAFSITAAAETSIITSLDKTDDGQMNGSVDYEKAASGEAGDIAKSASDLSERHLAYFQFSHPTTYGIYSEQSGEGKYLLSGSTDAVTMLSVGGGQTLGMSIYSSSIGPVQESVAPYISDEGWIRTYGMLANGEPTLNMYFRSYEEAKAYVDKTWTAENIAKFNEKFGVSYTADKFNPQIAKVGTWAVDDDKMYGYVAELKNSSTIPSTKNEDGSLLDSEVIQMKNELSEGRSISIGYHADQSVPGEKVEGNTYLNTETWGQYTYDASAAINHAVTIVGWDDNYSKENFAHKIYDENGNLDPDWEAKTTPASDGAWIVRNSWGSSNNVNPLYNNNWGVDGSGYFYLSYCDQTITNMETYEFDTSAAAQARSSYTAYQYDLSNTDELKSTGSEDVVKTSNVFDGPEVGEDAKAIRDLGYLAGSANGTTTLEVYVMNDSEDVAEVIAKGNPVATVTDSKHDDAGYHRVHLDTPVIVNSGQKFAVVQTTKRANGEYEYTYRRGDSREFTTSYTNLMKVLQEGYNSTETMYFETVINEGESLVFEDGKWQDWKDVSASLDSVEAKAITTEFNGQAKAVREQAEKETDPDAKAELLAQADALEAFYTSSRYAIDNWMIKAYGDDVKDVTKVFPDVLPNQWYTASIQRVYGLGYMTGNKDAAGNPTTFGTHDTLTRAQAVAVLYNMAGKGAEGVSEFSDVPADAWYANAVAWAADKGIVSGYDDGRFGPEDPVTREQLAAVLFSMSKQGLIDVPSTYDDAALDAFPDTGSVSTWAVQSMKWAVSQKVLSGAEIDGVRYLQPVASSERCVMAAMISNIVK